MKVAYEYAKNALAPPQNADLKDSKFAERNVSKYEFKFLLRLMRLFYEVLYAWTLEEKGNKKNLRESEVRKVLERLRKLNHFYLCEWKDEEIIRTIRERNNHERNEESIGFG